MLIVFPSSSLARGTWIEIAYAKQSILGREGRPSHEGRGLKFYKCAAGRWLFMSSLARGTWIEIVFKHWLKLSTLSRPSHEGRGLKS